MTRHDQHKERARRLALVVYALALKDRDDVASGIIAAALRAAEEQGRIEERTAWQDRLDFLAGFADKRDALAALIEWHDELREREAARGAQGAQRRAADSAQETP